MAMTIKAARVNKGLTQAQAAEKLGITSDQLSNYERGISEPKISVVKRMEEVYEVPYSELIFLPVGTV